MRDGKVRGERVDVELCIFSFGLFVDTVDFPQAVKLGAYSLSSYTIRTSASIYLGYFIPIHLLSWYNPPTLPFSIRFKSFASP